MNRPLAQLLMSAVLPLVGLTASAQEPTDSWRQLAAQADRAGRADKLAEAESLYRHALEQAEGAQAPPRDQGLVWNELGLLLLRAGKSEQAVQSFERAISLFQDAVPPEDPNPPIMLANLGLALRWAGRLAEATDRLRESLALREQHHGLESLPVAQILDELASLADQQDDHQRAATLLARSLKIRQAIRGPYHDETINSQLRLADQRRATGAVEEAEALLAESLASAERLFGPDAQTLAVVLRRQADLWKQQGDETAANQAARRIARLEQVSLWHQRLQAVYAARDEEKLTEAEELTEACVNEAAAFGPDNQQEILALSQLGELRRRQGRMNEALEAHLRQFAIAQKVFGADHPEVAATLLQIARIQLATDPVDAGLSALQQALDSNRQSGFPNHALHQQIAHTLSSQYFQASRYKDAVSPWEAYLAAWQALEEPPDATLGVVLNNLGVCYFNLEQTPQALSYFEQAQAVWRQTLPPDDPNLTTVAENLAAARRAVPAPPATDNDSAFASADLRSQDAVAPVPHDVEQTEGTTTYIDFKVLVFQFLTALVLQWQARKRGYSPLLWFVATLLSHVFVTMSILAMLPDRSLAKQRARETQAVDALLANRRGQTAPLPSGAIGQESIGDALTQAT